MKKFILPTLISLALASSAFAQTTPLNSIAATVDEDVILKSEFDQAMATYAQQIARQNNGKVPPEDVLRRQVMERLIMTKLQVSRAEGSGITVSDEDVMAAINEVAQNNNWTIAQLRANLEKDGMSFAAYQAMLKNEISTQRLQQSFAQQRIAVSEAEVDNLLKNSANTGAQMHLGNILISVPEGATADQIATAKKKADAAKAKLDAGADFAAVATEFSDGQNALQGGDLGWRSAADIPPALVDTIRSLQPGQTSAPVRGPTGFQILQLKEVRQGAGAQMITQYKARHILVPITGGDEAASLAKANDLRARIAKGADFAKVAKDYSGDVATKAAGGDLGWFDPEAHGPEFATALQNLTNGGVSTPVRTAAGFHIIQRQDMRQVAGGDEALRNQAREAIGRRKLEDEWNRFMRSMRNEAFVQYFVPGFENEPGTTVVN